MKHIVLGLLVLSSGLIAWGDEKKAAKDEGRNETAEAEKEMPAPKTLEEAHLQLEQIFPKEELAKIDAMKSEDGMNEYHFELGMRMRNSWGLWGGQGPLWKELTKLGCDHPDTMSGLILETFWCRRHKQDFRLKERMALSEAYKKAAAVPPESAKDPRDQSEVKWQWPFRPEDVKSPRHIHVGRSKKTGRWLAYEHDKGVYEPDAALLLRIEESEKSKLTDPFLRLRPRSVSSLPRPRPSAETDGHVEKLPNSFPRADAAACL